MSCKIHFLNHASLVIEYEDFFLILDPWPSDEFSFDSWKPHPPCFLNDDILSAFINGSKEKAGIIISHAHDDHCDDYFLKKISASTNIFLPNYKSKGSFKRIKSNNLENIKEINHLNFLDFGPFSLSSYIIHDKSEDDAVILIKTDKYLFVHANDNSTAFPEDLNNFIKENSKDRILYFASQTGIANGFPYCYPQILNLDEKKEINNIALNKIKRTIQIAINNANIVGADYFITYAAFTISMSLLSRYKTNINQFFPSPKNIRKLNLEWGLTSLLDFVPGDTLDVNTQKIDRPFWLRNTTIEEIAYQIKNKRLNDIDSFNEEIIELTSYFSDISAERLIYYIKNFLMGFYKYTCKLDNNWKNEILNKILEINIDKIGKATIDLSNGNFIKLKNDSQPNKRILINKDICLLLISGHFNFESLYIGHFALFERFPPHKYNFELMHQLSVYGYIYQKRLVPKDLKFSKKLQNNSTLNYKSVSHI
tara:strand:- start:5669 stop:7111 length:1443 start_codon:yes stop_codon:yes gene_type:complete